MKLTKKELGWAGAFLALCLLFVGFDDVRRWLPGPFAGIEPYRVSRSMTNAGTVGPTGIEHLQPTQIQLTGHLKSGIGSEADATGENRLTARRGVVGRGISDFWFPLKLGLPLSFLAALPALLKTRRPNLGWVLLWLTTLLYTTNYTVVCVCTLLPSNSACFVLALRIVTALAAVLAGVAALMFVRYCRALRVTRSSGVTFFCWASFAITVGSFLFEVYQVERGIYWLE